MVLTLINAVLYVQTLSKDATVVPTIVRALHVRRATICRTVSVVVAVRDRIL